ncbi:MAG: aminodeoxychorismate/anthranilate synthase component II, partial [Bacteroidota bacterium]
QAICRFFGAKLINLDQVHHGVQRNTNVLNEDILFQGIPAAFPSGRYHSWLVDNEGLPSCLKVIASDEGMIMAVAHTFYNVKGLQFHPESVMTPHGKQIIKNWLISVH